MKPVVAILFSIMDGVRVLEGAYWSVEKAEFEGECLVREGICNDFVVIETELDYEKINKVEIT